MNKEMKEKAESLLSELKQKNLGLQYNSQKVNTSVYLNGAGLFNIYYRVGAVRIDVKINSLQESICNDLLNEKLIYQKETADPYAAKGRYSFFVDEQNLKIVFERLIKIAG